MKVQKRDMETQKVGCSCDSPCALMLTHERPGLLGATVSSFQRTAPHTHLYVFDDGSDSVSKQSELGCVRGMGVEVVRMPHRGFAQSWQWILWFAKENLVGYDSMVMLEDDIIFAAGWLEVLQKMQRGMVEVGFKQGLASCFRPHLTPQSVVVDLCGVEAYQSMAHSWHANMMPMDILDRMDVVEESVREVAASKRGLGLDVYLVGNLAHRLKRLSFVSMQSWVGHMGFDRSVVGGQGYGSCKHPGVNLVEELRALSDWAEGKQATA